MKTPGLVMSCTGGSIYFSIQESLWILRVTDTMPLVLNTSNKGHNLMC